MSAPLFVTGMQRSGTTLLEKLLASHPQVSLLSQPFPFLFVELKRHFLRTLADEIPRYPLGHLFLETRYRPEDFATFLRGLRLEAAWLRELFAASDGFPGQYTLFEPTRIAAALDDLEPGDPAAVLFQLWRELAHRPDASCCGAKETICEEFLPYLLDRECRGVVILRDPRDVLTSLISGEGPRYGGKPKSTLFTLRLWRKSVAFALHLEKRPGFAWVRYEDLVESPQQALDRIAAALGLESFPETAAVGNLRDQSGHLWTGNSSLSERAGVSRESVGSHRGRLSPESLAYVEAVCHPEMLLLGYPVALHPKRIPEIVQGFREPYGVREGMEGYSSHPANVEAEVRRAELLSRPEGDLQAWFVFAEFARRLAAEKTKD